MHSLPRVVCASCLAVAILAGLSARAALAARPEVRRVTQDASGDYQGNDETPILKALADLGDRPGTVVIGPGEYLIRRPIQLTSGKTLRGNGRAVLRLPPPVVVQKDAAKGQDSLVVSDTRWFAPQTQVEIVLRDGKKRVVGCCIEDIDDEAVDLDHFAFHCEVTDNVIRRGHTGVTINDGSHCLVADNHIERCSVGVTIWWWHMCPQDDIDRENIVRGNRIVVPRGAAISVGKRCYKNQIVDNTVDGKVQVVESDNEVRGTKSVQRVEGRVTSAGKPLAGVAVSDGLQTSATDGEGRYALGITPTSGPFVFVSTPRGYWTEAFYISTAQAVAAKRADFELKAMPQPDRFDIAFVTDMHVESGKVGLAKTEASFREINALRPKPAFLWAQGDITLQGRSGAKWQECLKLLEMPVRNGPGNHEMLVDRDNPREEFHRLFGPTYYSFDWGPAHCIVLDGNKVIRGVNDYTGVHGAIEASELEWLRSDLRMQAPGKPIIVGIHIPIVTTYPQRRRENPPNAPYWEVANRKVLTDLFAAHNVRLVLEGHMHENERIMVDGVEYVSSISLAGSWFQAGAGLERGVDNSPRGYRIVSVDGDKVTHRYQSSAESRVERPGEFVDRDKPLRQGQPGRLVFNCYDAPVAAKATLRIDGGPWRDMPSYAAQNKKVGLTMLHHFALNMEPVALALGKHRVEVRVESQQPPFSAAATGEFTVIQR